MARESIYPKRDVEIEDLRAQLAEALKGKAEAVQARAELEAIFAAMAEAALVYDTAGQVVRANPTAVRHLGFDPTSKEIGTLASQLSTRHVDGRALNLAESPAGRALRGETVLGEAFVVTPADGMDRTLVASAAPLVTAGLISGAVVVWHDATEEERVKAALRESEQKYSAIFEKSPFAMALISMPEGTLVDVNNAFLKLSEYSREEVVGKTSVDLGIADANSRAQVTAEFNARGQVRDFECVRTTKSGAKRILSLNLDWVSIEGEQYSLSTVSDITERKRAEEALRDSEGKYRTIISLAPAAIYEIDFYGHNFISVNDTACQWLGYSREELLAMDPLSLTDEAGRAGFQHRIRQKLAGEAIAPNAEMSVRAKDGRTLVLELNVGEFTYREGQPVSVLVVAHDVTERRRAEAALAASENELRLVMNMVPALIAHLDRDFRYRRVNSAYEPWFGLRPQDIEGCHPREIIGEAAWELIRPRFERALTGETVTYEEYMPYQRCEPRWISATLVPYHDAAGKVQGLVTLILDITERKRAQEALRQSETLLRAVLDSSPDPIFLKDRECRLVLANPATLAIIGKPMEAVIGKTDAEYYDDPATGRAIVENDQRIMASGQMEVIEESVATPEGTRFYLSSKAPFRDAQGQVVGLIGTAREITERKRVEAERARALAKAQERAAQIEAIFASINDVVLIYDPEMNVAKVNPAFQAIYGFDPIGLNVREIIWRVHCRWLDGRPFRLDEQPTPRALRGERVGGARFLVRPPGASADQMVETASTPLHADGKVIGSVTVWHDITERERLLAQVQEAAKALEAANESLAQQAEELYAQNDELQCIQKDLRQSEERYRTLFSGMTEGFALHEILCDGRGVPCDYRFLDVNPAFERLTGLSRAGLIGRAKSQVEALQGDDPKWVEIYGQVALGGEAVTFQNYSPALKRWYQVYCYCPAPRQFAVIFTDITERKRAEQEREQLLVQLEAEKARWQATVDNMLDPVTVADAEGRAIYMNAAYSRLIERYINPELGLEEHAAYYQLYRPDGTLFPVEELPLQRAALSDECVGNVEIVQRTPGGTDRIAIWNAAPLHDASGRLFGAVAVGRDITDQRQAERALQAQTETLLEQAHMLDLAHVLVRNMDDVVVFWNQGAEGLYGWTKAEAVGQNSHALLQTVFPTSAGAVRKALHETGHWEGELQHTRRDGTRVVVASHQIVHRDKQGQPVAVIEVNNDVTALKQAEEELRRARDGLEARVQERTLELEQANAVLEEEVEERRRAEKLARQNAERLSAVAEASHVLVEAGFDDQAMLERVAGVMARFIGEICVIRLLSDDGQRFEWSASHHADPAQQSALREFIVSGPLDVPEQLWRTIVQTGHPLYRAAAPAKDLRRFTRLAELLPPDQWGSLMAVPLKHQSIVSGTVTVLRSSAKQPYSREDLKLLQSLADRAAVAFANARLHRDLESSLAQEKSVREQLIQAEKLSALGRMVSSVAHELNNPLQTITNCLYLTHEELPPDSPIHDYLGMAQAETQRLVDLVAQLRELYRMRPTAPPEARRLDQLLREVEILMAAQLHNGKVEWLEPVEVPGCVVNVIQDRLKQVFINLATNAIDAMRPDGGQLRVDVTPTADGQYAAVTFTDSGPGILPENLSRVFEPFFTTKPHGLGLGLAICYEIVAQHGGKITVESPPGQGAAFTVWLPLVAQRQGLDEGASQEDAGQ